MLLGLLDIQPGRKIPSDSPPEYVLESPEQPFDLVSCSLLSLGSNHRGATPFFFCLATKISLGLTR